MDDIDRAAELEQAEREAALNQRVAYRPGPPDCVRCGGENDQRREGYAVCLDCADKYAREAG